LSPAIKDGSRASASARNASSRTTSSLEKSSATRSQETSAGLLMRSFERLLREDPGFTGLHSTSFNLQVPSSSYEDWPEVTDFYARLVERISEMDEVRGASVTAFLPLDPGWSILRSE